MSSKSLSKKTKSKIIKEKQTKSLPIKTIGTSISYSIATFSPSVNKNLESLIEVSPNVKIYNCDDENSIQIEYEKDKYKCVKWNSKLAEAEMLKNIRSSKINSSAIVAPLQIKSNCWFNCFFMIFFIDDKGKNFFRYLRETMVTGILPSGKKIPNKLHKTFFFLNRYIDSSLFGYKDTSEFALTMDTNVLIQQLGERLNEHTGEKRDRSGQGNPLKFYREIINYLNEEPIFILNLNNKYPTIKDLRINKKLKIPDIVVLTLTQKESENFTKKLLIKVEDYTYILSSIVLNDLFSSHFSAYITVNDNEFAFDGRSFGRLNRFNWSNIINKDTPMMWSSKDIDSGNDYSPSDPVFLFKKGYQQLFYYRVE